VLHGAVSCEWIAGIALILAACSSALPTHAQATKTFKAAGAASPCWSFLPWTDAVHHTTHEGSHPCGRGFLVFFPKEIPMDRSLIKPMMPSLVAGHVPRNVRSFKYRVFDGQPQATALGFTVDPQPFDGKVIAVTDEAIVVKLKPSEFAVLDPALVSAVPTEGTRVHVQPYARRRFDGLRADTPEERTEVTADGIPYTVKTHILGSAPARLPIPEPRCVELGQLIGQLEDMPAPDGFRRITHMLVDAGARDFTWVDPTPARIIETPPSISFMVSSAKFDGRVTILYDRANDTYVVELRRDGEPVERHDEVYFDMLGEVLERLIDDGRWRLIDVQTISTRTSRRIRPVSA